MASLQSNINNLQSILTTINSLPEQSVEKKGYKFTLHLTLNGPQPNITINGKQLEEFYNASYNSDNYTIILTNITKIDMISNIEQCKPIQNMILSEDTVLNLEILSTYDMENPFITITVETGNSYNICILGDCYISKPIKESMTIRSSGEGFSVIDLDPIGEVAFIKYGYESDYTEEVIEFYAGDTWGSYLFSINNILPFDFTPSKPGFYIDKNTGNIKHYSAGGDAEFIMMETGAAVNVFDPIMSAYYEAISPDVDWGGQ